jgi:hypothetical protein
VRESTLAGVVDAALLVEPARALRHKQHANEEHDGGDHPEPEHPAPVAAAGKGVVHEVGNEDPARDRQLVQRDQRAADLRRGELGDVEGADDGGEADPDAVDQSAEDQHLDVRRERHDQRADEEDHGADEDEPASAEAVGEAAAERCTDDRAAHRAADDEPLDKRGAHRVAEQARQVETRLDIQHRTGDNAGVEAEQEPVERSQGGDDVDEGVPFGTGVGCVFC